MSVKYEKFESRRGEAKCWFGSVFLFQAFGSTIEKSNGQKKSINTKKIPQPPTIPLLESNSTLLPTQDLYWRLPIFHRSTTRCIPETTPNCIFGFGHSFFFMDKSSHKQKHQSDGAFLSYLHHHTILQPLELLSQLVVSLNSFVWNSCWVFLTKCIAWCHSTLPTPLLSP